MKDTVRCAWAEGDPLSMRYHDTEWCVRQVHDDRTLFELMVLEAMQCGLSWRLILQRREAMRAAMDGFDPAAMAAYDDAKFAELLHTDGVIRMEGKLRAMSGNAARFLEMQKDFGSFDAWLWSFTGGKSWRVLSHADSMPAKNALSEAVAAALRKRGFRYLGPVTVYSYLQAVGMLNDHSPDCFAARLLPCETALTDADIRFTAEGL